jgi:6-phosphogluconolactonase
VRVSPGGNCLISTDLGLDEITTFEVDAEGAVSLESVARLAFPAHSSPRHIEFHPSGKTVYVNGEHDSMVHVLDAEDGLPKQIRASHSSRPPGYDGVNSCSELHLHPDGHTLYVGNRGSDYVAVFAVDDGGDLTIAGHQPALGRSPRAVRLDPTGRYLVVGNRNTSGVIAFQVGEDPLLAPVGEPIEVPSPSSLVFVPAADGSVA